MTGARLTRRFSLHRCIWLPLAAIAALSLQQVAFSEVVYFDGFGDADRDNDGVIEFYDTDLNNSGTWNDPTADMALINRGITEVTAATDPSDVGIIWSGIRSYDTSADIPKGDLAIINDNVAIGSETSAHLHNDGLALGVESRGGGSSVMGRFPQSVQLGPTAGDRIVVSFDFRTWGEANLPAAPPAFGEFRYGLYEDTDNELGTTAPYGQGFFLSPPGEIVEWGRDDGNWFASQPGAEGDKGIRPQITFGDPAFASEFDARIQWEYNLAGINGGANNGRILEGNGVSDTPGTGGDTGTIANPTNPEDGPGGFVNTTTPGPHELSMEIVRLANGLIEVASFIDGVEILRDDIKNTDTGYSVLGPPPFSYDYIAFRPSTDYDYVIDNFMLEVFNSSVGLDGDFNQDGSVDTADYVFWRKNGLPPADYDLWKQHFGETSGPGGGSAVPEPASLIAMIVGTLFTCIVRWHGRERITGDTRLRYGVIELGERQIHCELLRAETPFGRLV